MIREQYPFFQLDTEHTSYCFRVTETGHLEHLHYGRKITSGENLTESDLHAIAKEVEQSVTQDRDLGETFQKNADPFHDFT